MTTDVLAIVQARSSSSRLPGKVLEPVEGEAMVLRQLERIARAATIDTLVVATSVDESDDVLADLLAANGLRVRRGPLHDVFSRFSSVVEEFEPSVIVRLTADCPLTDPAVIDAVVTSHLRSGADYSSNVLERTFPHGLDVECVSAPAFAAASAMNLSAQDREHVTLAIYSHPELFRLNSVTQSVDRSALRWTVDYPEDLAFVRSVYSALYAGNPAFDQQDIVDYLQAHPALNRTGETL